MKLRFLKQPNIKKKPYKNGFTLIELVISLSLLLIILAAIFYIFIFVQKSYNDTAVKSTVIDKTNIALAQINADIRSASKPNKLTNSIVIHNASGYLAKGQSMDVYYQSYDVSDGTTKYYRVAYRLLPSDKSKLQRGWVKCSDAIPPENVTNPTYGDIIDDQTDYESGDGGKWKTILDGIIYQKSGSDVEVFKDITVDAASERRTIKVTLIVNDVKNPMKLPITIEKSITSRTK